MAVVVTMAPSHEAKARGSSSLASAANALETLLHHVLDLPVAAEETVCTIGRHAHMPPGKSLFRLPIARPGIFHQDCIRAPLISRVTDSVMAGDP